MNETLGMVGDPRRREAAILLGSFLARERVPRRHHEEARIWTSLP